MRKITLQLEPLSCPSCIKKIEGMLNKMEGMTEARVLFNASKVKVQFDEKRVSAEVIEKSIASLGYPVLSKKVA
ncbi:heavy-metal-associated domain-containing protein [Sporosarcina aquimarina]|uniref:Heavy-metal-associated domain-containing protein n=1 Tax=Sporosarcina aquimarina TaxID=114975 RepID=A0ABU4FVI5_9BACL|nr:heavy-metal-associated domain-containing protein [Sporosarcina aquimarina]MDW0108714.1 heavy-metal-associated domain-containing protein [Sporosarcina aquimarina]